MNLHISESRTADAVFLLRHFTQLPFLRSGQRGLVAELIALRPHGRSRYLSPCAAFCMLRWICSWSPRKRPPLCPSGPLICTWFRACYLRLTRCHMSSWSCGRRLVLPSYTVSCVLTICCLFAGSYRSLCKRCAARPLARAVASSRLARSTRSCSFARARLPPTCPVMSGLVL